MEQIFTDVIQDYKDNERSTLHDVEIRLKKHLRPAFGAIRAAHFSTGHVQRYVAQRRREKAAKATIDRELAFLKHAFHLAAQADAPSVSRVPYIAMLEEKNVRKGFLEHSAYMRLRNELPEHLRLLFVVGYHVEARRGELTMIQWPQVDFTAKRIVLHPGETKNDEPRTMP